MTTYTFCTFWRPCIGQFSHSHRWLTIRCRLNDVPGAAHSRGNSTASPKSDRPGNHSTSPLPATTLTDNLHSLLDNSYCRSSSTFFCLLLFHHSNLPPRNVAHVVSISLTKVSHVLLDLEGMSSTDAAHLSHASMSQLTHDADTRQQRHAEVSKQKESYVSPTDGEAVAPKRKTQTLSYIWRSGVAGGVAGCAVS